jgi:2-keto-3-deoxy-L-rhamnonate aldolase RhmA
MPVKSPGKKQLAGIIYSIGSLSVAEMISQSGLDWVMIDMEHSALSLSDVQDALPVFGPKMLKIVRVPCNDETWIKQVLDTGCDGIMVPMIKTPEDAVKMVNSARYPPEGRRSVGITRAHGYGLTFSEYVSKANSDLVLMAQIEHHEAVSNIDSILKTEGINAIFIGPYDLSASMGLAGQVTHPDVLEAIGRVKDRCRAAGMPYGFFWSGPEAILKEASEDCRYILCGIDIALFSSAIKGLSDRLHNIFQ